MSKLGKAKLRFEVVISVDEYIGEEEFNEEFGGEVDRFIRWLWKHEGMFWDKEELKFVGAEPIKTPKKEAKGLPNASGTVGIDRMIRENTKQSPPESMEEFDRLITPYRDVLDEDSVRTLRARVESVVALARNSALDEAIRVLPERIKFPDGFDSAYNACIDESVAKLKKLKKEC